MKKHITCIVVVIVVAIAGFYGGMQYSSSGTNGAQVGGQQQSGNRQAGAGRGARGGAGGFINGDVLSKDATSVTLKMRDGSTKIVFYSAATTVQKTAAGAMSDIVVGSTVSAMGTPNSDGSVTAQTISLRPAGIGGAGANRTPATTPVQ